jgi:L-lactate dehydrogenase (cytochrome)
LSRRAASVSDYRALAKARLPHFLFEYLDGGSYDEVTLRRNVEDLRSIALRQRVLRDVSDIDLRAGLFGQQWAMPVGLGPVGLAGLYARRGEVQAARAAAAANVPFALSTVSGCSLAEVAASGNVPWFQLYFVKDRGFVAAMIETAKAVGCGALILTVDLAVPGSRYRDARAAGAGPRRTAQLLSRPDWLWDVGVHGKPHSLGNLEPIVGKSAPLSDFQAWIHANFDPSVSWKDVEWVRRQWNGPLILKGILDPDDARHAADSGADAIVVSNHGGAPARRSPVERPRASGDCRGGFWTNADSGRRRRTLRARCRADACARRRLRPARTCLGLCAGRCRRERRRPRAQADRSRDAGGDGADRLHAHRGSGSIDARLSQATSESATRSSRNS